MAHQKPSGTNGSRCVGRWVGARNDTGNGGCHDRDERAFRAEAVEGTLAVGKERESPVAHPAQSLRRGVGGGD